MSRKSRIREKKIQKIFGRKRGFFMPKKGSEKAVRERGGKPPIP